VSRADEQLTDYFAQAEAWDAVYDQRSERAHWWKTRLDTALELVGAGSGALLEVGPGPGRLLAELANRGWTVSAVDISSAMAELARARVPAAAERIVVGRAEALPFADNNFDVVVAIGILQYTDRQQTVAEIRRVLRPGGRAVIGFQSRSSPALVWRRVVLLPVIGAIKRVVPFGRAVPPERQKPLSGGDARAVLAAAGLRVEREMCLGCAVLPDPLDRLAPRLGYALARRAERSARLRRVLGTQRVFLVSRS
jgi:SAM-dependent methyltransferase